MIKNILKTLEEQILKDKWNLSREITVSCNYDKFGIKYLNRKIYVNIPKSFNDTVTIYAEFVNCGIEEGVMKVDLRKVGINDNHSNYELIAKDEKDIELFDAFMEQHCSIKELIEEKLKSLD